MPGFFLMLGIADAQHADVVRLVGAAVNLATQVRA